MRTLVAVAAMLLLAPAASAGSPDFPEAPDPEGDAPPGFDHADLLGVWLSAENGTLAVGFQVKQYGQAIPGACWGTEVLRAGAAYRVLVSANQNGHVATFSPPEGADGTGPAVVTFGERATLLASFPKTVLPATPGDILELRAPFACSATAEGPAVSLPGAEGTGAGSPVPDPSRLDEAEALRPYSVPYPKPEPVKEPPKNATKPVTATPLPNATKTPQNSTAPATNVTSEPQDVAPAAQETQVAPKSADPPAEKGFFGLPGPGAVAGALAAAFVALASRRRYS